LILCLIKKTMQKISHLLSWLVLLKKLLKNDLNLTVFVAFFRIRELSNLG
jgi:hypothetical protein